MKINAKNISLISIAGPTEILRTCRSRLDGPHDNGNLNRCFLPSFAENKLFCGFHDDSYLILSSFPDIITLMTFKYLT